MRLRNSVVSLVYLSPHATRWTCVFTPTQRVSWLLENVEHCGGEPEQAVNMHMNRLSFTLKWWAESVAFMSVIYVRPLPEAIRVNLLCIILYGRRAACRWWSVHRLLWQTGSKVPCILKLEPSLLRLPTLHSGSTPALPSIKLVSWPAGKTYGKSVW